MIDELASDDVKQLASLANASAISLATALQVLQRQTPDEWRLAREAVEKRGAFFTLSTSFLKAGLLGSRLNLVLADGTVSELMATEP